MKIRRTIGENETQLVMVQLAARRRLFNLVPLATLRNGNYPGEAWPKREGVRKKLCEEGKELHEEAQRRSRDTE